jgi:hypothetical protein
MQPAAVNLDAQKFFEAHIAQMDCRAEVVQKAELAGLVRRFEEDNV